MNAPEIGYVTYESPLGRLLLAESRAGLVEIRFPHKSPERSWQKVDRLRCEAVEQLEAYFQGDLLEFDLPLAAQGTPFQSQVWQVLLAIPFGQTRTYAQIARQIGRPKAFRAVGAANGQNPLPIVVPCHRVIGSDGSLTGFGGGLDLKKALLEHEAGVLSGRPRGRGKGFV